MDLEQSLTVEFSAVPGLANKVYPIMAAQGTKAPYLTYTLGGTERTQDLLGQDGLVKSQYQLDLYHTTYASVKALKKLVVQTIKTFSLRNPGGSGPYIQQVELMTDYETYEDGVKLYRGIVEFNIHSME